MRRYAHDSAMTAINPDTSPHYALSPAAKHSEEQESPALRGMIREKCPNCSGAHPAWSKTPDSVLWPTHNGPKRDRATPTDHGKFTNFEEDDDPFTGGRRNAGDNLSPEASPRKRTRTVFSRPLASANASARASATPTNTQLSNG
ncbi:hypothetical protein E4U61_000835 [Claviceps capensis]|nr:hypothetical protein E4U61_000835 [Claviceps capensis]